MSTIPTSVTEEQFDEHLRPFLSTAQRGCVCKIALVKVFNYLLYRLPTGCQLLPILTSPKKGDQLASGLLPLPELECRWTLGTGLAAEFADH